MTGSREKLTLANVSQRKESSRRLLANNRYLLTGSPRRGGLASVYRAFDTQDERYVAIKLFRPITSTDEVVAESFRRETQALSDLYHPHIVRIFEAGFEANTAEHYIAMEWVERDLTQLRDSICVRGWAEFYGSIGRPVLEAVAFAHTHATIHRDIKPSNVLVTPEGVAKVCDFGISKIRNFLEPGVTLAQYASAPFAPPESDDGTYSYSRDVFGFAALCVAMLAPTSPESHRAMHIDLERLALDDRVRRLLRRCLSLDSPADRPSNAVALIAEFDRLQPRSTRKKSRSILIALTKKIRDIVEHDLGIKSDAAIDKLVESDLVDALCLHEQGESRPAPDGSAPLGRAMRLYGSRYGYVAVKAPPAAEKLLLVSALEMSASDADRYRDRAYEPEFSFVLSGTLPAVSSENISALDDALLQFAADQKVVRLQQREQAIFKTWLDLLSAKTELERQRRRKIRYEGVEPSGAAIRFRVVPGSNLAILDEQDIRVDLDDGGSFGGAVMGIAEDSLLVHPSERNRIEATGLPESGFLILDTGRADAALEKQRSAVDAVRYGRAVNPALGTYIVSPGMVPVPSAVEIEFIQSNIDEDKKDAVRTALSGAPLMLVQGPPGTGKTTFITELVLQTLRREPSARILLTSQTHVALDNSLERIEKEGGGAVRAVRIGHEDDDRIAASTKPLLIENKLPAMRRAALAAGKSFIERWATEKGVDLGYTRMAMALEWHAGLRARLEHVEGRISEGRKLLSDEQRKLLEVEDREEADQQLTALVEEQQGLLRDLKESLGALRKYERDKDTIEHLASCSAAELRAWADTYSPSTPHTDQLRRLLSAHADWEVRFGRSREFRAALIASSQVVAGTCLGVMSIPGRSEITYDLCIVDEASIATPTEVLVPMSRARHTVLVGDDRQLSPFQDPELKASGLLQRFRLTRENQRATLFNHLRDGLPAGLRKTLTTQHRMVPAIGNLISACFYDSELCSADREPLGLLRGVIEKPVVWFSTSRLAMRKSKRIGTSQTNDLEVQFVARLLARVDFAMRHGRSRGKTLSVAVLTGYGEQRKRLRAAVETTRHDWESFSDIFVNVIDAFQGRDADVVIFSVTRSDATGLGFLREMERINVALSRGKEHLVIVGDHLFCQEAESRTNPLREVLDYIRAHPNDCALEEMAE